MALGVIAAASGLLSQGAKIWAGARQRNMAKKLKKSDYVPSELTDNRDLAQQGAYSNRGFNQSVDEAEARKGMATTAYSMKQMAGGAAKKLAVNAATSNRFMNNMANIRQRGRNARMNRVDRFMDANQAVGAVKLDNQRRYEAAKSALLGASMQNIYGGIADLPNTIGDILGSIDNPEWQADMAARKADRASRKQEKYQEMLDKDMRGNLGSIDPDFDYNNANR